MLQLAWAINWYTAAASGTPSVTYTGPTKSKWYNSQQTVSWKIVDYAGGTKGVPGTGIAGFTQGWDAIPADPSSEAYGGTGNSFYSGPQYPNATKGCLSFVAGSCSGGVGQGCHTVHVEGWNNQGVSTGNTTYGPLCYDTVAPTTTASSSTAAGSVAVKVTLSATDPGTSNDTGAGVSKTYYSLDNSACVPTALTKCSVYASPFTVSAAGAHTVRYFSEDKAGNFEKEKSLSFTVR
jgi:hypothetical protein